MTEGDEGRPQAAAAERPGGRRVLLVAACVAAVHLAGVTNRWWPTDDSSLYLSLGRSLAAGEGYRFNGRPCNAVTPALPWILAGLRAVAGEGYWAANLFEAICGLGVVALACWAMAAVADRHAALLATAACGLSYTFFLGGHRILTGMPFALLYWATIASALRARSGGGGAYLTLTGLTVAAAITVRAPGAVALGPLALGLMLDRPRAGSRGRAVAGGVVVLAVTVAAVGAFYLLASHWADDTPLYATGAQQLAQRSAWSWVSWLAAGLWKLPFVFAEMLTSQKALMPLGLAAMMLMGVGATVLWRRGWRMPALAVGPYVLGLTALGKEMVRPRYFLPIQPLCVLMMLVGLRASLDAWGRRRNRPLSAAAHRKVATIAVAVLVAINAPRLARNAFYYSYLSHTDRYYEVILHGRHAERERLSAALRQMPGPHGTLAVPVTHLGMLHYLTGRQTVALPCPVERREDVGRIVEFLDDTPDISAVVLELRGVGDELKNHAARAIEARPGAERFHRGEDWAAWSWPRTAADAGRR